MRFTDKVALVTGGAQGIGKAVCIKLASEGATIIVSDINEDGAKAVAEEISNQYGVHAQGIKMDVTDDFEVHSNLEQIDKNYGRLDILVANAGIVKACELTEFPVSEWRQVIDVNLVGYMICAKHACQIMKRQDSGVIIQINSMAGKEGCSMNSAYAASKFGGIGLTQSLALEMAPHKVRVNAVCPGNLLGGTLWKDTLLKKHAKEQNLTVEQVKQAYIDQVPLGRSCEYDDVTNLVAFLASDESSYITGQAINITGGQETH